MGALRVVPLVLILAGAALIADAVAVGGASVALVVVVPVVFGSSLAFLLGVVLLIFGLLSLPWALAPAEGLGGPRPANRPGRPAPTSEVAGLVLIGPVPFFFGRWSQPARAIWTLAVVLGALVLVAFLLVLWLR